MRRRSLVSMIVLAGGLLLVGTPRSVQAAGGSAVEQGETLLSEIHALVVDAASRASVAEAADPPQVSVANCLNEVGQTLNGYEASAVAALSSLKAAVNDGDGGTAKAHLDLLLLAHKNAKIAAATAAACETGSVAGGGVDADGDGLPDGFSSGGLSGLDGLEGDSDVAAGFSAAEYLPVGDSVDEAATIDVVTSPAVTP